jgi:predicted phosphodiesterase
VVKKQKTTDLDEVIRARVTAGQSQKSVAREFGVTEWRVRTVMRAETTRQIVRRKKLEVRLRVVNRLPVPVHRCLVFSDIHIPYHDQAALAVAMRYAQDCKPDTIVLNGDILDAHEVSSHPRDKHAIITFEDELSECRQFLRVLRSQHRNAAIFYTMGNHENRVERYLVNHAPDLSSLPGLSIDELLDLKASRIHFVDGRDKVSVGPLEIFHGSIIRKDSGNSARGHLQRRGGSVLMGHTHRMAVIARTDRNGVHWGVENGHLSHPEPSWAADPDWQQGFTEIAWDVASKHLAVRQHHIADGKLVVDGVLYRATVR